MVKITKYIAICLVLIGTVTRAISQHHTSEQYSTVLRQILSLQFDAADKLINKFGVDPETGFEMIYLRNYLEFLDALITGDGSGYEKYLSGAQSRLDSMQSYYGQLPDCLPRISAIHLQTSFLNAFHGENFKAARNFYVANRYLRQAESARPGMAFNQKLTGLINVMAGSAPTEYHWLMSVFGIRGDIQLGLDQLQKYHEMTSGTERLESCFILLYSSQITWQETSEQLDDCNAETVTLLRYFFAYRALKSGRSGEVIELLAGWQQAEGEMSLIHLDLLLGEALLNSADARAGDQLKRFLNRTEGQHYVKTAWHKLSWHYFLTGDSAAYKLARANVIAKGNQILDADKQAFREAGEIIPLNVHLLRARLYFDGGYYQRSYETLQEISQADLASRRDSLEYTYRLARIADRMGKREKAITGYHKVVEAGGGSSFYFPSNAVLHLGRMYEERGDTTLAMASYQNCLKMNRSAYRNSIGNKAKEGIRRLQ